MRKIFILLVLGLTICSCGASRHSASNTSFFVTENGVAGLGTATSQNERNATSIAVRLARAHLIEGINSVLNSIDQSIGIEDGTHVEHLLRDSKIVNKDLKISKDNFTVTAVVELSKASITEWADNYYNNLPDGDPLHKISKEEFIHLLHKSLNTNN